MIEILSAIVYAREGEAITIGYQVVEENISCCEMGSSSLRSVCPWTIACQARKLMPFKESIRSLQVS